MSKVQQKYKDDSKPSNIVRKFGGQIPGMPQQQPMFMDLYNVPVDCPNLFEGLCQSVQLQQGITVREAYRPLFFGWFRRFCCFLWFWSRRLLWLWSG